MKREYIFQIDMQHLPVLGSIRCRKNLQAAADGNSIWLKGIDAIEMMDMELKKLPIQHTFQIDQENQLFRQDGLVPIGKLQALQWQNLASFIKVEPPISALPASIDEGINIQLIESANEQKSTALLTSLQLFKDYAETAPAIRLERLAFAVSDKDEVFIVGHPLPPLPGKEFWQSADIFIPAGLDFELQMAKSFVNKKMNEQGEAILVFDKDGSCQKIEKSFLVEAKRSAVRLTKGNHD
jgi:hypothetical protein